LGYDGFYSFRSELQNKVREHLGYSERVSKTLESVSKKSILRQSFQHDIELLKNTASSNSEEDFAQATNQICRVVSVYILGQRSSNALAYFLHFRLSRFGINCKLMVYGGLAVLSELAPIKKGDLLIVTGFNRIPKEMCAAVGMAKARRAKVLPLPFRLRRLFLGMRTQSYLWTVALRNKSNQLLRYGALPSPRNFGRIQDEESVVRSVE